MNRFVTPVQRTFARELGFLGVLLGIVGWSAPAQAQLRVDSLRQDLRHMAGDIWSVWTSPVHATEDDWAGVAAAAALTGVAATADRPLAQWITNHPNAWPVRTLKHTLSEEAKYPAYEFGSGQYLLPLSGVLYLAGAIGHSQALRDAGLGCATAHLTSAGAREVVYLLVARDRPRLSPDDPFVIRAPGVHDWNEHSFFSGHIANSLGCASFLSHRFDLHAATPVLYGFTIAIGAGRIMDGRHWLSDTVVGALFGYATGKAVAARMLERENRSATPSKAPLAVSFSVPF
ncbi:MAG TPA: phosphatase PAP2 family protein [Gemmatimonadaceae bacterium]|nr:phosphatase PAP2 family protein [Gemmatimonadaceae bacterium]